MPSHNNKVIIAAAGSRKTTCLVEEALTILDRNVLITTYTNENVEQINSYIVKHHGHIPKNLTVMSWFSFLLQEGVRPYQNRLTSRERIQTINFSSTPNRYVAKTDIDNYYLTKTGDIYRDRVADFICECNRRSGGMIIKRLESIYGVILIDELQDLAGYDLNLLEALLRSSIIILAVGDPRQATFSTNNSSKNKQYKKSHILEWIKRAKATGLFVIEERADCYRSNQIICDFADALFPDLPKTKSHNMTVTGHDGIFSIKPHEVSEYIATHKPQLLRHSVRTKTMGLPALNIGLAKGRTYDRVLIFPTEPMKVYWATKNLEKAGDLTKLYVAVTRARYSTAFVI